MEDGSTGVGIGAVVAVIVSYSHNHSIFWAIVDGFLGWLYIAYAIFAY